MPKQRCGSCRFFQDAGLAGSGWCHHPLRKTTSDLLIMVRRNELACRDEWTRTLWEEGAFGGPEAMTAHPVDPASEVEIAALVRTDLETDEGPASDVVIGEARLVSDATPPWRLPAAGLTFTAPPPPPAASFDSRTAILRAREAYRERQKAAERGRASAALSDPAGLPGLPAAGLLNGAADALDADDWPSARLEPDTPSPAAVPASVEAGVGAEWEESSESVWAELEVESLAAADEAWSGRDPENARELEHLPLVAAADDDMAPDAETSPVAGFAPESAEALPWEAIPVEPLPEPVDEWSPSRPEWGAEAERSGQADWSPVGVPAPETKWWGPVAGASPALQPEPDAEGGWRGTPVWDETWIAELARESARGEHWAEWDLDTEDDGPADLPSPAVAVADHEALEAVGPGDEVDRVVDLPLAAVAMPEIAPGVPRICRTCRDFRPADGGDRGWCANQWAFTHRRLVDPEEPAPCESAIGNWWLPADELYIGDADISAHGLATPLLDRWLPGHGQVVAEPERKQS